MSARRANYDDQIVQIIPAKGWYAIYAIRAEDGGPALDWDPLVCWALYQNEATHDRWIAPLVADTDGSTVAPSEASNFLRIAHETLRDDPRLIASLHQQATEYLRRETTPHGR